MRPITIAEKEYIERKEAIKMIRNDLPNVVNYHRMDAIECLELMSTADVVEVVRCKDCTYRDGQEDLCGNIYCKLHDSRFDKDGYCSYGKRDVD